MSLEASHSDRDRVLPRVGKHRLLMLAAVVVLLALGAAGAYALFGRAATTVTITPISRVVSSTYTLSAVTSLPDASKQQVAARLVSATTPTQTRMVNASGHLSLAATQAKGTLVLRNWDRSAPKTFAAGTVFPDLSGDRVVNCPTTAGTEMVLDASVTLPAADASQGPAVGYAPGHVLQPGADGNIPTTNGKNFTGCYYYIWTNGFCTPGWLGYCWTIEPASPFTGGQDAYNGPMVQQNDIDTAASSLISAHQPDPQQVLQPKIRANERLAGTPQCAPQVRANHQAGDQAAQVKVTVSFTCTGEVYDDAGALEMAAGLLSQQAAANPGGAYTLIGKIKTAVTNAVIGSQGTITLTVSARGVWAYQFTDAQQQQLAALLAGKSERDAAQLAFAQPGVASVTIHLPANQHTLPTDPRQIRIIVQAIPAA